MSTMAPSGQYTYKAGADLTGKFGWAVQHSTSADKTVILATDGKNFIGVILSPGTTDKFGVRCCSHLPGMCRSILNLPFKFCICSLETLGKFFTAVRSRLCARIKGSADTAGQAFAHSSAEHVHAVECELKSLLQCPVQTVKPTIKTLAEVFSSAV